MKPVTDEQVRILRAAREGRLEWVRHTGRYVIEGEARPNRRERERLQGRAMLTRDEPPRVTEYGLRALALYGEDAC